MQSHLFQNQDDSEYQPLGPQLRDMIKITYKCCQGTWIYCLANLNYLLIGKLYHVTLNGH